MARGGKSGTVGIGPKIGKAVERHLKARGGSATKLARDADISGAQLSRLISGKTDDPPIGTLLKIFLDGFGMGLDELLEEVYAAYSGRAKPVKGGMIVSLPSARAEPSAEVRIPAATLRHLEALPDLQETVAQNALKLVALADDVQKLKALPPARASKASKRRKR